ncbi:MAG: hypothetical protein IJW20_04650 [Clostridia bacterium]|nr:hypothetical protein [Clostridia bacterium]
MTNNSVGNEIIAPRKVEVIKLVSQKWLFTITVTKYPDYKLSEKLRTELNQFVENLKCKLVECGSGTTLKTPIIAYTVKIENDENAEELVKKIKEYIFANVVPII